MDVASTTCIPPLMYYILIKSFNKAIKGEMQGWGVLKRTGNVRQVVSA
jgi:hypothetical protein